MTAENKRIKKRKKSLDRVSGGSSLKAEKEQKMARREKRVWRGVSVLEEIRVVPLADGRREAIFVLRDEVGVAPKKGQRSDAGGKEKGGSHDD